ncbi:MAG: hypothetical protein K6F21_00835 [Bacteroidales bacterium]|nr:hypothetical protein [Bacteroidales bacterium]
MKKVFLLVLFLLLGVAAFAEPGVRKEERKARKDSIRAAEMVGAHRKGTKIKLDGVVLEKEQQSLLLSNINMEDYNDEWSQYAKKRRLGNGLAIGGSSLVVIGGAAELVAVGYVIVGALVVGLTLGQADQSEIDKMMKPAGYFAAGGLAAAGLGVGALAVGIPIRVKADKGMKAICDEYNGASQRVEKSIIFGATNSGVGLSFNF